MADACRASCLACTVVTSSSRNARGGRRRTVRISRDEINRIEFDRRAARRRTANEAWSSVRRAACASARSSLTRASNGPTRISTSAPGSRSISRPQGETRWGRDRRDGAEGERNSPVNPNRPLPDRPAAALIGRIGDRNQYLLHRRRRRPLPRPRLGPPVSRHQRRRADRQLGQPPSDTSPYDESSARTGDDRDRGICHDRDMLNELSTQMADAVDAVAASVVQVQGRRRPASGLVYADGIVLTTMRAIGRRRWARVSGGMMGPSRRRTRRMGSDDHTRCSSRRRSRPRAAAAVIRHASRRASRAGRRPLVEQLP